jgi:tetratricopeptide (TPR) repeat protein
MRENDQVTSTFHRAMKLRDEGAYEQAVEIFESFLTEDTDGQTRVAANINLGHIYTFCLSLPGKGESYFRAATELVPSYDVASLGLFHSLAAQGRHMEALDEMKRYMSNYSSSEYVQLIREMKFTFTWFN